MVVALISVDVYPFLAFLNLTCQLEDTGKVFPGCTVRGRSRAGPRSSASLPAVNYYDKALHLGCCTSPRSASDCAG